MNSESIESMEHMADWSDEKLYFLCRRFGHEALHWRGKFLGLLPEVYRRRLYEKHGHSSIFEFAKKLAGISEEQVRLVLNLEKKFYDKPALKTLLETGTVSANKLARIASIATHDNQEFLALQARLLPQKALETLARDERNSNINQTNVNGKGYDENGLQKTIFKDPSLRVHTNLQQDSENANLQEFSRLNVLLALRLSQEVLQKLLELQNKGIDINTLLLEFLDRREQEIEQEKEKLSEEIQDKANMHTQAQTPQGKASMEDHAQTTQTAQNNQSKASMEAQAQTVQGSQTSSRYIPTRIKQLIQKEYGTKCSIQNCHHKAEQIHHTQRFALVKTHDPKYLAPLCKDHHLIAHAIDLKFQEARVACRAPPPAK